jgi:dihydroorotate dehydrogenase electron transfer subunit
LLKYEGAEYYIIRILAPEIANSCTPGQFVMVKCGAGVILRRPISIHSADSHKGEIELLFSLSLPVKAKPILSPPHQPEQMTVSSKGTNWLKSQKKGNSIEVLGPLGNGFLISADSRHILLVAGGIGIAPLRFLAEECTKLGKDCSLLIGARTATGVYPVRKLPKGIKPSVSTEDGSLGIRRTVTQLIADHISLVDQVFACGPKAMYVEMARQQRHYRWTQEIQVSLELRMGCGFGVCYGCSIKTRQGLRKVCRDGPVFNIKDIIWQEVNL